MYLCYFNTILSVLFTILLKYNYICYSSPKFWDNNCYISLFNHAKKCKKKYVINHFLVYLKK